jgi:excisionase family DNA binding protein
MTIAQAAEELGVHLATAYRWVESRVLHTFRIGDQVFVTVEEVRSVKSQIDNGDLPTDKRGLRRSSLRRDNEPRQSIVVPPTD